MSGVSDELAQALAECYQRKHWLEQELDVVCERASEIIEQIRAVPYMAGLERHAPADAVTQRFRVPEYVRREWSAPAQNTEVLVRPVDCPDGCFYGGRHIHTADGAVHPVDLAERGG